MTSPRTSLSAFATGLAERLPGVRTSGYQRHARYEDRFPRTEQLWDAGHVDYIVSQYVCAHDAVLHGPAHQRLDVTDRPRYPHQFVVAPLAPAERHIKPHHFDAVEEPNGIAVPKAPPERRLTSPDVCCPATSRPCDKCSPTRRPSPSLCTGPARRRSTMSSP